MRGDDSSNEERLEPGRNYRTDRTEGISDGVFAVSLTLLILDVRPPEGDVSQLVHGLVLIAPRLGTFALSLRHRCVLLAGPPPDFRLTARREGRSDLGEHAVSIHDCRVALLDRGARSLRSRAGGARDLWCQSRRLYVDARRCVVRRGPLSHHRTPYSRPTTLRGAAFRASVDCRAAGDRMRVPCSGTRTGHLRRAADCVRTDLPPAVLLTAVVRRVGQAERDGILCA